MSYVLLRILRGFQEGLWYSLLRRLHPLGYAQNTGQDDHIEGGVAIYGYSIQEYSADRAIVRVYIIAQKPGGSRNVGWVPVRMVWEEGDWRLDSEEPEMKASIATEEPAHYVPIGLDQYAAWGFKKS